MFGYIKTYKPELRIKEFEMYKAVYCSLCRYLGKNYGRLMRFTLSYDFTFLALLNLSLSENTCSVERKSCVFNPFKKCSYCKQSDEWLAFPAAVSVITVYYNILDNVADEKGIKKAFYKMLSLLYKKAHKKAAERYPEVEKTVCGYITEQSRLEKENCKDIDAVAEPTGTALAEIFKTCGKTDSDRRALSRLGYCLGRYIYLADAFDDMEDDRKKKNYNPLLFHEDGEERAKRNIYFCINESINAFELIDIKQFKNILGNIIYMGLENSAKLKQSQKE